MRWGAATQNPVERVEKVKPKRKAKRTVTDNDFAAVYELASPQLKVAMSLGLLTGLRRGDLLSLTRDNLTEDGLLIDISKTSKKLLIEYSPALLSCYRRIQEAEAAGSGPSPCPQHARQGV